MLEGYNIEVSDGVTAPLIVLIDAKGFNSDNFQRKCSVSGFDSTKTFVLIKDIENANSEKLNDLVSTQNFYFTDQRDEKNWPGRLKNFLIRNDEIEKVISILKINEKLIGKSPVWRRFLYDAIEAALYSDAPVLIMGESGTGKELAANLIHSVIKYLDNAKNLITVDCTTLTRELSGSELFGHEKGSFTNASYTREGAVELANRGTLFLDEIGELPMELQSIFLRTLQEGTFKRVGGNYYRHSDFRLIAATNKNLLKEVEGKKFREDLFYRIGGVVINIPPLRDRMEDIPALCKYFITKYWKKETEMELDKSAINYLMQRKFRGNVRELEQFIKRLCYKYIGTGIVSEFDLAGCEITQSSIDTSFHSDSFEKSIKDLLLSGQSLQTIKDLTISKAIDIAISSSNGVIKEAARKLRVTERAIQKRRNGYC